ncbi:MAG: hypothetical protein PVG66_12790 [Chromatiales bacterium]|jgi:hypothetical protein
MKLLKRFKQTLQILLVFGAAAVCVSASAFHFDVWFAKPFSGQKVRSYDVELAVSREDRKFFTIPKDCDAALEAATYGATSWGGQIDRNLWYKVVNDCKYFNLLHQNMVPPDKDFVSNYDFYNAELKDLPFAPDCGTIGIDSASSDCPPIPSGILNLSSFFPFLKMQVADVVGEIDPCKFTNGMFRGRLIKTPEGITCQSDRKAPGLRLVSVDYADLNGDGYQDVLLRIMPLGRGISHMPILLPLTRLEDGVPFSVPAGVALDYSAAK